MEVPQITDFEKVIEPHLDGGKLVSYTSKYLTKPGDNYGSIMLLINATLKDAQGKLSEKSLVAKLPPLTNEVFWQIFQPERTCISENTVYQYLAPEIEKLQREAGVSDENIFDGFPRYYGSRISLNTQATKVDRDALLLQENVQLAGYKPGDRSKPYDLAHTLLVLKYLAQYHALPIALRLKKPEIYDKFVRPHFKKFDMGANMGEDATNDMNESVTSVLKKVVTEKEVARATELLDLHSEFQAGPDVEDGPYTTIVHFDLWINNIMIKYAEDGSPERLKFVDFQVTQYESLVHDIFFFLLINVETEVVDERYEELLKFYYTTFIECLERVKVDTSAYTYEGFLTEVKRVAHLQIPHALFMAKVIFINNTTLPEDFKDVDLATLNDDHGNENLGTKLRDIIGLAKKFEIFF